MLYVGQCSGVELENTCYMLDSVVVYIQALTSTTFRMCLLTTQGSGLVVTPDAQSRGARLLLGVVGEFDCMGEMC